MSGTIKIYISTVAGNLEIKKKQQRIQNILGAKKIAYEEIDIAADQATKEKMRELIGDPKAVPPQIFNGDTYCGNFEQFDDAVEGETLEEFLKLK